MSLITCNMNEPRVGFGIVNANSRSYVVPGWYEIPYGTKRNEIKFTGKSAPKPIKVEESSSTENAEWTIEGSRGAQYKVTLRNDRWDCSCPARQFRRGDCKHIKAKKLVK